MCDQRYALPLIVLDPKIKMFMYLVNALRFAEIKLEDRRITLSEDKTLPRIAFISQCAQDVSESIHMAKTVFQCTFGSTNCNSAVGTLAELAVGFMNVKVSNDSRGRKEKSIPWTVIHLRGDYEPLVPFLEQFNPDITIIELSSSNPGTDWKENTKNLNNVVGWNITNSAIKTDTKKMLISGRFNDVSRKMKEAVVGIATNKKIINEDNLQEKEERKWLSEINVPNIIEADKMFGMYSLVKALTDLNFDTL